MRGGGEKNGNLQRPFQAKLPLRQYPRGKSVGFISGDSSWSGNVVVLSLSSTIMMLYFSYIIRQCISSRIAHTRTHTHTHTRTHTHTHTHTHVHTHTHTHTYTHMHTHTHKHTCTHIHRVHNITSYINLPIGPRKSTAK